MTNRNPEPQPCEVCGRPIVWALSESCQTEHPYNEGRPAGGFFLAWRPYLKAWQIDGYRRLDGIISRGPAAEQAALVYPRHACPAAAKKAWTGDPAMLRGWRFPGFKVSHPVSPRLDTVDGLPDPF